MTTPHASRTPARPRHGSSARHRRERGQVVVLFAGAILALIALCAVVIDVAWYWTSNLRMQRAADAAALAGVVWLPGNPSTAFSVARAEATKNGYTNGAGGVVITPSVDPANNRRLRVEISAPVGTFFARAVGVTSWPARREAKADYVLPVPMGSPVNYYGVGFYEGRVETTYPPVTADSGWRVPGNAPSGGQWAASSGTIARSVIADDNIYATESGNGQRQMWSTFGLQGGGSAIPTPATGQTLTIVGVEARLSDAFVSATCANSTIGVDLSWNGGSSWSTRLTTPALTTSTSAGDHTLGASDATSAWGAHTWVRDDFSDSSFRIRLQANKGCGTASTTLRVDMLEIRVSWRLDTASTWSTETLSVNDPVSGSALASQGFWGAMFTSGGVRQNGDKYGPAFIGSGVGSPVGSASPSYDAAGYDYTIELPGGAGQVRLFDPMFCATGSNGHGGSFGAGDHWTDHATSATTMSTVVAPVAITYRLYDTQGTVNDITDDGAPVAQLDYNPGTAKWADLSGRFGTVSGTGLTDCADHPAHNRWVTMGSGLANGTYRLNVNTSLAAGNMAVGAENLFSIWVSSAGSARVYGGGRMAAYTNLDTGQQKFYFAQIERVHAGKTMVIRLFDPGETSGSAYLRLLSPDGNIYRRQTFDWTSDDGRSGTGVQEIQTSNGSPLFDNREITITVALPASYGQSGLNPLGDVTDEQGWWLIEYQLANGNDTTTWSVDIRGNPVHLVTP